MIKTRSIADVRREQEIELVQSQVEQQRATIEYIAMMQDIDIDQGEGEIDA